MQTKRHRRFAKLVGSSGTLTWGTGSGRVRSVDEPYPERMGAGVRTLARQQKLQGHEALCCFQVELDGKVIERLSSAAAQNSSKSARVVFLMAPSVEEKERWVRGIRTVLEGDPVEEVAAAEAKREEADDISRPALGRQVSGAL